MMLLNGSSFLFALIYLFCFFMILRRKNSIVSASARKKKKKNKSARKRCNQAKREHYAYFNNIPDELTVHILLQLPINSLLICKSVCKNWKTLISEPYFAKLHLERATNCFIIQASDDYRRVSTTLLYHVESDPEKFEIGSNDHVKIEPVLMLSNAEALMEKNGENDNGGRQRLQLEILNSCNGLLCLYDLSNRNPLVICNPITKEFIRLPEARTYNIIAAGFGFHPKTNEYKVIRIKSQYRSFSIVNGWRVVRPILEIHTVGTRSWKNVEMDPQISISDDLRDPTCINSALHWIKFDNGRISILCFNFESERLQLFPPPPLHVLGNHTIQITTMGESRGFLYICERPSINNVTMWLMKKYGIGESWTKVYNIDVSVEHMGLSQPYCGCWPIKHFEEGVALFLRTSKSNCFIYYEPEKYGSKKFKIHGISHSKFVKVISHIPSLISLMDVVKGDNVEVLNITSNRERNMKFFPLLKRLFETWQV